MEAMFEIEGVFAHLITGALASIRCTNVVWYGQMSAVSVCASDMAARRATLQ